MSTVKFEQAPVETPVQRRRMSWTEFLRLRLESVAMATKIYDPTRRPITNGLPLPMLWRPELHQLQPILRRRQLHGLLVQLQPGLLMPELAVPWPSRQTHFAVFGGK